MMDLCRNGVFTKALCTITSISLPLLVIRYNVFGIGVVSSLLYHSWRVNLKTKKNCSFEILIIQPCDLRLLLRLEFKPFNHLYTV